MTTLGAILRRAAFRIIMWTGVLAGYGLLFAPTGPLGDPVIKFVP